TRARLRVLIRHAGAHERGPLGSRAGRRGCHSNFPVQGRHDSHARSLLRRRSRSVSRGCYLMTAYQMKPLSCDPAKIKGMSERLIVSHYENNYGGAVKRLNLIDEQLAELDYAKAAGFLINGLKREQLIAMNSMILHELFFDGLGDQSEPSSGLRDALARDFGSYERWHSEFVAMGKADVIRWNNAERIFVQMASGQGTGGGTG